MSNSHFIQFQTYIDQNIVHYESEFEKIIRQGWNGTYPNNNSSFNNGGGGVNPNSSHSSSNNSSSYWSTEQQVMEIEILVT